MSFSDLIGSSRGSGVIGSLVALIVLLGSVTLYLMVFGKELQGGGQTMEAVVSGQTQELEKARALIASKKEKLVELPRLLRVEEQLAEIKGASLLRAETLEGLKAAASVAAEGLAEQERQFEEYKNQYRKYIRDQAVGRKLAELGTVKGETYADVEIRNITPAGIQIRHEGGFKLIPFEALSLELQDLYQFDAAEKQTALERERQQSRERVKTAAADQEKREEALAEQQALQREKYRQERARSIQAKQIQIRTLERETRKLEFALVREKKKKGLRRPELIEAEIQAKKRQIATLLKEVGDLQSQL